MLNVCVYIYFSYMCIHTATGASALIVDTSNVGRASSTFLSLAQTTATDVADIKMTRERSNLSLIVVVAAVSRRQKQRLVTFIFYTWTSPSNVWFETCNCLSSRNCLLPTRVSHTLKLSNGHKVCGLRSLSPAHDCNISCRFKRKQYE